MAKPAAGPVFPSPGHDHAPCVAELVARADTAFAQQQLKLTPLRRRVLEEIAAVHRAVGAYDILERLAAKGPRLAPISVYRALDALVAAGVVHRLESRNAFFACHRAHAGRSRQLILICDGCGAVAEVAAEAIVTTIAAAAAAEGFKARSALIEVAGACAHCNAA